MSRQLAFAGWRPRFPEREGGQCASCPFLEGNDKQFGVIVDRLRQKEASENGKKPPKPATKSIIRRARSLLTLDVLMGSGDFACHASVYGADMEVGPSSGWRQCPGATKLSLENRESAKKADE